MSEILLFAGSVFLMYLWYKATQRPKQNEKVLQAEILYALKCRAENGQGHRAMSLQELEKRIGYDRTSRAYHKGFSGGTALDDIYQRPTPQQLMRAVKALCEQGRIKSPTSSTVYYVQ
jgi:hypothetical protein